MAQRGPIRHGREAFARQEWRLAFTELSAAEQAGKLEPDDLEQLAAAAYLVGEDSRAVSLWTRLHHDLVDRGNLDRAARCGFWLSLNLLLSGETARSTGWLARSERLLKGREAASADPGYGRVVAGLLALGGGDAETARGHFRAAMALAEKFRDTDLLTISLLSEGQLLIESQRIAEGIARLDEAMLAVSAGEVSPIYAGIVYCAMILTCQRIFDLHRARDWTLAMNEWCASQPDLVPFRGQCLVHRSEILQLRGHWQQALEEAKRACEQLAGRSDGVVGRAHYQRGELLRLRGDFAAAHRMYSEAGRFGCDPQPGLSLLRLAQGEREAAAAAIRGLLASLRSKEVPRPGLKCPQLLSPSVEILLAAGDPEAAHAAAAELADSAKQIDAPYLHAASAQAIGSVSLAQGRPEAASASLREAWTLWQQLEIPYEAARAQVLIARACGELGDRDSAGVHLQAARSVFERLGAAPDLADLESVASAGSATNAARLTERELEVLARVAVGETNKRIADALAISEHTVARHLSNIYDKLGVTSRTAASTFAHEHKLLQSVGNGQS